MWLLAWSPPNLWQYCCVTLTPCDWLTFPTVLRPHSWPLLVLCINLRFLPHLPSDTVLTTAFLHPGFSPHSHCIHLDFKALYPWTAPCSSNLQVSTSFHICPRSHSASFHPLSLSNTISCLSSFSFSHVQIVQQASHPTYLLCLLLCCRYCGYSRELHILCKSWLL